MTSQNKKKQKLKNNTIETDTKEYHWNENAEKWFHKGKNDEVAKEN